MSTVATRPSPLPSLAAGGGGARPAVSGGGGNAGGGPTVDPIRLLKQYKLAFLIASIAGIVGGFVAFELLKRFAPQYRSTVFYRAEGPLDRVLDPNRPLASYEQQEFERFMQTQARSITQEQLIRKMLEGQRAALWETQWAAPFKLGNNSWDTAAAVRDLSDRLGASVVTGTQFIQASASAANPADALQIMSALHVTYLRQLEDDVRDTLADTGNQLSRRRSDLEKDIASIRKQIDALQTSGRVDTAGGQMAQSAIDVQISTLRNSLPQIRQSLDLSRQQLQRFEELSKNQGAIVFPGDIREEAEREPVLQQLRTQEAQLDATVTARKQAGLGDRHADMIKLQTQLDSLRSQIESEREKAGRRVFDARFELARNQVQALTTNITETEKKLEAAEIEKAKLATALRNLELLNDQIKAKQTELDGVLRAEAETIAQRNLGGGENVSTIDRRRVGRIIVAQQPLRPDTLAFPRLFIMLPLGLALALGATGAVIVLREVLDQRIKGPSDINLMARARLLGIVPEIADDPAKPAAAETAFRDAPSGAIAESYRQLRPGIVKRMSTVGHKSLLVVGAMPQSGASSVAANLAMACASAEQRVLLIDANFRRPALHRVFKLGEGPGLGNVLAKQAEFDAAVQPTAIPSLHLLSAGNQQARSVPERLATEAMTNLIREAGVKYDLVIIDTAPAVVAGDSFALANRVDCSILVVRAMAEKRGLVARVRDQLAESRGELLGIIVNAVRASAGGYLKRNIRTTFEYQTNGQA